MTYTTKRCPHCDHIITFMDSTKHRYGSPFRICNKCGKMYIDKSFQEMAFLSEKKYTPPRIDPWTIMGYLGGIFLLIVGGISYSRYGIYDLTLLFLFSGLLFLAINIYSTISDIRNYKHRCHLYEEELSNSLRRVTNPDYLKALINIGYKVPKEYRQLIPHIQSENSHK